MSVDLGDDRYIPLSGVSGTTCVFVNRASNAGGATLVRSHTMVVIEVSMTFIHELQRNSNRSGFSSGELRKFFSVMDMEYV